MSGFPATLSRRRFTLLFAGLLASPKILLAGDPPVHADGTLIDGPATPSAFPAWIRGMKRWRAEQLERVAYDGSNYERPEFQWTQRSFIQTQIMVEERYFYDPVAGKYTVDRYLDDLDQRYGGIDSVVVWPTYPNLGVDDRDQFDMFRDLPGGMEAIRQMIADFHRRDVRVLFPLMPWDRGTRDEGASMIDAITAELVKAGADGINGDTMDAMPGQFLRASEKLGHPLALEPEHLKTDLTLAGDSLSWGHAFSSAGVPGSRKAMLGLQIQPEHVDRYKWLEPRHLDIVSDRWQREKTGDIQYAYFNGCGVKTWENIWGIWNGLTERDAETVRRIAKVEREFAPHLVSQEWEPHTPMLQFGAYASKWPLKGRALWTVINKTDSDLTGEQFRVAHASGWKYFDVWNGVALEPRMDHADTVLSFPIEANGFGAILGIDPVAADARLTRFLREMHRLNHVRLDSFSKSWRPLQQTMVAIPRTKVRASVPEGMVRIPAAEFRFQVEGIEIEGGIRAGIDVQYPWEDSPRRHHSRSIRIGAFYIDRYPVTNQDFRKFVQAAGYRPKDGHNFLKDWKSGNYPNGWDRKPVAWVAIEDARAYAAWAGKRLPHEWEWQYAAQSTDARHFPWGNDWQPDHVPSPDRGRKLRGPDDATAHPSGASPFGVEDLIGNIWQWTDEFRDEHTRAAVLRGGSYYQPQGSRWYFPQAYELVKHGKLLLMAPGRDRSGTIGFRCVVDAGEA